MQYAIKLNLKVSSQFEVGLLLCPGRFQPD
jgi:hypothetical protein